MKRKKQDAGRPQGSFPQPPERRTGRSASQVSHLVASTFRPLRIAAKRTPRI